MQVNLKKQAGILLLEVLAGVIILASIITGIAMMIYRNSEDTQAAIAAQHLRTVGDAAAAYIRNNLPAILDKATDTTPALIKVSDLRASQNLPPNFSSTNGYQQETCILVLENKPGQVTAMVVTEGGRTLDDATVNTVANLIGASGGAIRTGAGNFYGSRNSWQVATANFGNPNLSISANESQKCDGSTGMPTLNAGHPAMALWLANGGINPDVIYRSAIPGRSDLNHMETPLDLFSVTEGTPCVDSNGISIQEGLARGNNGSLFTCQNGKWKKALADVKTVLRYSDSKYPAKEGGKTYVYAICDHEKNEKMIVGTCTGWCPLSGTATGGYPHKVNGLAVGWKCRQYCKNGVSARAACTASENPVAGDGKKDGVGLLIATDADDFEECDTSGNPATKACSLCNSEDECTICPKNSIPGKTCTAPPL